ncbi:hypothetical protein B0T24DRAFT_223879, partial [Lasiosphaeria ovina]
MRISLGHGQVELWLGDLAPDPPQLAVGEVRGRLLVPGRQLQQAGGIVLVFDEGEVVADQRAVARQLALEVLEVGQVLGAGDDVELLPQHALFREGGVLVALGAARLAAVDAQVRHHVGELVHHLLDRWRELGRCRRVPAAVVFDILLVVVLFNLFLDLVFLLPAHDPLSCGRQVRVKRHANKVVYKERSVDQLDVINLGTHGSTGPGHFTLYTWPPSSRGSGWVCWPAAVFWPPRPVVCPQIIMKHGGVAAELAEISPQLAACCGRGSSGYQNRPAGQNRGQMIYQKSPW